MSLRHLHFHSILTECHGNSVLVRDLEMERQETVITGSFNQTQIPTDEIPVEHCIRGVLGLAGCST